MAEHIEMIDRNRSEIENVGLQETAIDLPDIPLEARTTDQLNEDLQIESFVNTVRKDLKLRSSMNKSVYKKLTFDPDGYVSYNSKKISKRGGKSLLAFNTLLKNPDTREFLQKIGYTADARSIASNRLQEAETVGETSKFETPARSRDLETVAPEQTEAINEKIKSFKITEDWAKKEKNKAEQQLEENRDATKNNELKELVSYYEQMELQAQRRYNEIVQNQFKRVNEIIHDETRSLSERLRELFRRDGIAIGAIITAVGMAISTLVLSIKSLFVSPAKTSVPGPDGPPSSNPKPVQKMLVQLSNWLLDMAKKALISLPGAIGSALCFLLKKAGELALFLSEHLILLFAAIILLILEWIFPKIRG